MSLDRASKLRVAIVPQSPVQMVAWRVAASGVGYLALDGVGGFVTHREGSAPYASEGADHAANRSAWGAPLPALAIFLTAWAK